MLIDLALACYFSPVLLKNKINKRCILTYLNTELTKKNLRKSNQHHQFYWMQRYSRFTHKIKTIEILKCWWTSKKKFQSFSTFYDNWSKVSASHRNDSSIWMNLLIVLLKLDILRIEFRSHFRQVNQKTADALLLYSVQNTSRERRILLFSIERSVNQRSLKKN